jgi:hypothetical protein
MSESSVLTVEDRARMLVRDDDMLDARVRPIASAKDSISLILAW